MAVEGRQARRQAREQEEALKKEQKQIRLRRLAFIGIPAICILVIIGLLSVPLFLGTNTGGKGNRLMNAIEKIVPNNVDAFFVTENTPDAAKYIQSIAASAEGYKMTKADYVGVALKDGKGYLYASTSHKKELLAELKDQGASVAEFDDVILINSDANQAVTKVAEDSLWGEKSYQSNRPKNNKSVAYMTNANMPKDVLPTEIGVPTDTWKWQGTYVDGEWVGQALGVKSTDFNLNKFDAWTVNHTKPDLSWLRAALSKSGSDLTISLTSSQLGDLKLATYDNDITDITVKLNSDGLMKLVLERN